MTDNTKITLSARELELVCDTDWILTKHIIIQKVYGLFGIVLPHLENILTNEKGWLPAEAFINRAKISKGENYLQLPYVMLDYPRFFGKEDSFAVRTFFWWGNFFSVTLQLSGNCKNEYTARLIDYFDYLQQNDFWLCINSSSWEHHFNEDNYVQIKDLTKENFWDMLTREPFVKIAKKIALQQWENVPAFITETFDNLVRLLKKD